MKLNRSITRRSSDPYAGPTLLTGRAAAVFFHEVFGHRAEGFRQKDISEGQTFTSKIGEQILPDFISIKDDPTEASLGGQMLLGNYPFDDEGVPATNVPLVDHGVLKTFLMSRSPLMNIPHSNGHGRRQLGYVPVARQGNLIVSSSQTMTDRSAAPKIDRSREAAGQALRTADRRYRGRLHVYRPRPAAGVSSHAARRLSAFSPTAAPISSSAAWTSWALRSSRSPRSSPRAISRKSSTDIAARSPVPFRSRPSRPRS